MTGFRPAQNLHAYSGGTVRAFHTILYSPGGAVTASPGTETDIHLSTGYQLLPELSRKKDCSFYRDVIVYSYRRKPILSLVICELEWENPNGTKPP